MQYLISFDLLPAKERLPNALNDACRLLFKEKNNYSVKNNNCVRNTTFISFVIIFIFIHYLSSLKVYQFRYKFAPCALYHTNKRLQYSKRYKYKNTIDNNLVFRLLCSFNNHILLLYLYYFEYCNRLFYSQLA